MRLSITALTAKTRIACAAALLTAAGVVWAASGDKLGAVDTANAAAPAGTRAAPAVARDAVGNAVVVWHGPETVDNGIYAQRYSVSGSKTGTQFAVHRLADQDERNPAISMAPDGSFVVVWERKDPATAFDIRAQRYTAAGVKAGVEDFLVNETVTAEDQDSPAVAVADDGSFWVVWRSSSGSATVSRIRARRYDASGAALTAEIGVDSSTGNNQRQPALGVDALGNAVVGWTSSGQPPDGSTDVFLRRISAAGVPAAGAVTKANLFATGDQSQPALAVARDGGFVVAWQSPAQDGDGLGIFAHRYDAADLSLDALDIPVQTIIASDQSLPALALDARGRFAIAWQTGAAGAENIALRLFNADGTAINAAEISVNNAAGAQTAPALAVDADGDLFAAWESGGNIQVQRLSGPENVDLHLTLSDSVDPVTTEATFDYSTTLHNHHASETLTGNALVDGALGLADNLSLTHPLPAGASRVNTTADTGWSCTASTASSVACTRTAPLAADVESIITTRVTAPSTAGSLSSTAVVTADQADAGLSDNSATETTEVRAPTVSFVSASSSTAEDATSINVQISISPPASAGIRVPFTFSGSAVDGTDYLRSASPLVLPAGATSANITITPVDDSDFEGSESIILTLGTPEGASLGASFQHSLSLADNDTRPRVNLTSSSQLRVENSSATITAQLSGASFETITVPFSVSGSASNPADYGLSTSPLSFSPGQTTASLSATLQDDSLYENDESIVITLGTPVNAGLGDVTAHTLTISNDDPAPVLNFSLSSQNLAENGAPLTVTATLSAASGLDVSAPFTTGGTALGNEDYSLPASPLTILAGSTSASLSLTPADDAADEPNETVILTLGTPVNATLGARNRQTVTITDNDPPRIAFATDRSSADENAGVVDLIISLSSAHTQNISLPFSISGGSAGDADYTAISSSPLTIPAGASSLRLSLNLNDDALNEANENIIVTLGTPSPGSLGLITTHALTVLDDDAPPAVSFSTSTGSVAENASAVNILVQLSAASARDISLPFTLGGTASADDYSISNSPLRIPAGDTSVSLSLRPVDDSAVEGDETVEIVLGTPSNARLGSPSTFSLRLRDNEPGGSAAVTDSGSSSGGSLGFSGLLGLLWAVQRRRKASELVNKSAALFNRGVMRCSKCSRTPVRCAFCAPIPCA